VSRRAAWFWIAVHLGFAVLTARRAMLAETDTRPAIFLAHDDPVRASYRRLREEFGDDAFLALTARGDPGAEFDALCGELAVELSSTDAVADVLLPEPGTPLADALGLAPALEGRRTLLVTMARRGAQAVAAVESVAARYATLHIGIAGQPALRVSLDEASDAVGKKLFPFLVLAMGLLVWLAYRSVVVVVVLLATTGLAVLGGMAIIAQAPLNLVTVLLPVLLLALGVALGIHLLHAYRRALQDPHENDAVRAMLRAEWRPCLVTSLTTAAGFGSFAFARIEPLRLLGVAMAGGILFAFVLSFTFLPALLVLLRPQPRDGLRISAALARIVPRWVERRALVLATAGTMIVGAVVVLPYIDRETNGLHYLPASHPLRQEATRLRDEGVGTATVDAIVRIDDRARMSSLATPLRDLAARLQALPAPVRGVVTPLTVAGEAAARLGSPLANVWAFAAAPAPIEARLRPFRNPSSGAVRVSLHIDPLRVEQYARLRDLFAKELGRSLDGLPGVHWEISGEFPIIMTVQTELLNTLLRSLLATTAAILLVLTIALRSPRLAVLTLLPAAVPLAFVVLASALFGVPLSIATVMVLAVTLGIVTDDSVHMIHAWRQGHPLVEVLRRVGTAVTETSLAIMLGFLVCGAAGFLPTRHFGFLTAGAMVVALFADLIVFPALLAPVPVAVAAPAPPQEVTA